MILDCPIPIGRYDRVVLGHGSGGRLSAELVAKLFVPALGLDPKAPLEDQATLSLPEARIAMTTDAFVVRPLFFRGGDIGRLAVCGTVNDLAVGGAEPRWISAAFIIEEGLPMSELARVAASMRSACEEAGVALVTGDTKVVERGKGDGVYITTTGVGLVPRGRALSIAAARPGDLVWVSGPLGDHGVAVLSSREGIELDTSLESDVAPITAQVRALLAAAPGVRAMRDPTRGGLSSALHELAAASGIGVRLDERAIPFREEVRAACELWGFDPMHMASEGRFMAVIPPGEAEQALAAVAGSSVVGECVSERPGVVSARSGAGAERVVTMLAGEPLPRIC